MRGDILFGDGAGCSMAAGFGGNPQGMAARGSLGNTAPNVDHSGKAVEQ